MQIQIHAARNRNLAFTIFEAFASKMDRNQRRRTSCINGQAGPVEIKEIGDTIRDRPGQCAGANKISVAPLFGGPQMIGVRGNADKDTNVCAFCFGKTLFQAVSGVASILNGCPNRFQEQTLLRIDYSGLLTGNVEELGIKLVIVVEKATPFTVDL